MKGKTDKEVMKGKTNKELMKQHNVDLPESHAYQAEIIIVRITYICALFLLTRASKITGMSIVACVQVRLKFVLAGYL